MSIQQLKQRCLEVDADGFNTRGWIKIDVPTNHRDLDVWVFDEEEEEGDEYNGLWIRRNRKV